MALEIPGDGNDEQWQLLPELEYTDAVDSWNVRASPELDSYVLCVLQAGQPFSVLGQQEDWLHIRTENGVKGWSYKKFGDRQVLVPVGHVGHVTPMLQPEISTKSSGDLSELMSELGERRRSLSEAPPASAELVRAAQGVQKTMAKLELYGIEQDTTRILSSPGALFQGASSKAGVRCLPAGETSCSRGPRGFGNNPESCGGIGPAPVSALCSCWIHSLWMPGLVS